MAEYYDVLYREAGNHYANWSFSSRLKKVNGFLDTQPTIDGLIDMGYEVKIEKVYA